MKRSSSGPSLRWSFSFACSIRSRWAVEVLLVEERGAVDAGQHLAGLVAAPVGAGDRGQLEGADAARRGRVRAAAEVLEGPVACRSRRSRRPRRARGPRSARPCSPGPRPRSARSPRRSAMSRRSKGSSAATCSRIFSSMRSRSSSPGRVAVGELDVVVEAVGDRRADRDLRLRPELQHGLGQDVGRVVADQLERLGDLVGDDLDLLAAAQGRREVAQLAVVLDRERGLGEAGADRRRGVRAGGSGLQRELRAVGKLDLDLVSGMAMLSAASHDSAIRRNFCAEC